MIRKPHLKTALCVLLLPAGLLHPSPAAVVPDDVNITLRRPALEGLILAATPYQIDLGSSLLRETLVFSEPRGLSFSDGKITFSVRCRGTPFPVDQILKPLLSLRRAADGRYQAVVESLPVAIPGYGQVDLRDVFPPIDIQSLVKQTVFLQGKPAQLDVRVRRIAVKPEQIDVGASLILTPAPKR